MKSGIVQRISVSWRQHVAKRDGIYTIEHRRDRQIKYQAAPPRRPRAIIVAYLSEGPGALIYLVRGPVLIKLYVGISVYYLGKLRRTE